MTNDSGSSNYKDLPEPKGIIFACKPSDIWLTIEVKK